MRLFIALILCFNTFAADRSKIGSVINAPIHYKGALYFLSTSGSLYKADSKLEKAEKIFSTEKNSASALTLDGSMLYFGEGIHQDSASTLYGFDLKTKKAILKMKVEGHIERLPLVTKSAIYVGLGPAGVMAIDKKTHKTLWIKSKIDQGKIHVDSNIIDYKDKVCFASVYQTKGVVCLLKKSGKQKLFISLSKPPKSEIGISGDLLYGMATNASLAESKWKVPTQLYIIDLKNKKKIHEVKLRGYNFWKPKLIDEDTIFVTLSTGDLLLITLSKGKINFIGEVKAPITSTPFFYKNLYCATSINGNRSCFQRFPDGFKLIEQKQFLETVVGEIGYIKGTHYLPTRTGYLRFL